MVHFMNHLMCESAKVEYFYVEMEKKMFTYCIAFGFKKNCHDLECTFLKIKKESNLISVNFNSFPLTKRTFLSRVDFSRLRNLKKYTQTWVIWMNSYLIKIKGELSEVSVWVYWTCNQSDLCVWRSCPQRQGLHGNRIPSTTLSNSTEAGWANHLDTCLPKTARNA